MKTSNRLKRAFCNPKLFCRGLNRVYHQRAGIRNEYSNGVDVFQKDWDSLIILDGCRFDIFEEVNNIDGVLSSEYSKGSATAEWLQANVEGKDLSDTVYVTANPQLERHRDIWNVNFHETINVWLDEGWDQETGTVLANTVNEAAMKAFNRFPNKRLVIHYMQPHYPFVRSNTRFDKDHLDTIEGDEDSASGENIWNKKFLDDIHVSRENLWEMYKSNLEYVLEHVAEILQHLIGKTVITSDHGNYIGERASPLPIKEYGHPRGLYDDPVIRIPWFEYINGNRREIIAENSGRSVENIESDTIGERLQDLGYLE